MVDPPLTLIDAHSYKLYTQKECELIEKGSEVTVGKKKPNYTLIDVYTNTNVPAQNLL